jgi:SPP1 gp7 family putative phage head morphogenesis protein
VTPTQHIRSRLRRRHLRKQKQLLPRQKEPSDLAYRAALLTLVRALHEIIRKELGLRQDSFLSDRFKDTFHRIRIATQEYTAARAPWIARKFVAQTAEANRVAMNAQFARVMPLEPFTNNNALKAVMSARVRTNVDLINSIPTELVDQVESVVTPYVSAGVRVEDLAAKVQERFDVSESRAQLIARDQVGKFNGQLTQERHESLGVDSYTWSTSGDERVRADHKVNNGKKFSYDEPPVVNQRTGERGNPGEDIQCRCQALPNVSDLLDSLGIDDGLSELDAQTSDDPSDG